MVTFDVTGRITIVGKDRDTIDGSGGRNPDAEGNHELEEEEEEEEEMEEEEVEAEEEAEENSESVPPDGQVLVQLRHVYGQDPGLFQEFSGELLSPLLRLIPSAVSPPEGVRLASTALLSLRENCPRCLFRKHLRNRHSVAGVLPRSFSRAVTRQAFTAIKKSKG
eukprot:jgi/Undpi1/7666/HiC_scaffold_23.g10139.m1